MSFSLGVYAHVSTFFYLLIITFSCSKNLCALQPADQMVILTSLLTVSVIQNWAGEIEDR